MHDCKINFLTNAIAQFMMCINDANFIFLYVTI